MSFVRTGLPRFGAASAERNQRIDRHLDATERPDFQDRLAQVFQAAQASIQARLKQGEKGFVVFDIDETVLDNRGYFRDPAGTFYKKSSGLASIRQTWDAWVGGSRIPVIPAAKAFIDWLNANRVPYCFLTGIEQHLGVASMANLKQAGVWGAQCLGAFYKPDDWQGGTRAFKAMMRPLLEVRFGLPVMATVGDRPGDMAGDPQKDFLLPSYVAELRRESDNG